MPGKVDRQIKWQPGNACPELAKDAQQWHYELCRNNSFIDPEFAANSAIRHGKKAVEVTDAIIYQMIMPETGKE